jgi:ABC-2 type transport system ATP-binding protein
MSPVIEIDNLICRFGDFTAVKGLSFKIEKGQVLGFIGANGAGKTTTMRCMATLESPTEGSIKVCGHNVIHEPAVVRKLIGWMPDDYGTYSNMNVYEYLDFFARAYGYKGTDRKDRVEEVMDFADLSPLADRLTDKLSKGMSQRLCLGRTLLHDPEIMILDEPAAGLDPKARLDFKRLVRILAEEGKTLFISSHILNELEEMCDSLLFIDQGELVHHGTSESLKQLNKQGVAMNIEIINDPEELKSWVEHNPGVQLISLEKNGAKVLFENEENEFLASQLAKLINDGISVITFKRDEYGLEESFVNMINSREDDNEGL